MTLKVGNLGTVEINRLVHFYQNLNSNFISVYIWFKYLGFTNSDLQNLNIDVARPNVARNSAIFSGLVEIILYILDRFKNAY